MRKYSDEELLSLLHDIESDWVERKESFSGDAPRREREAVCAFANDLPNNNKAGVLFIGAKDDGTPSGLRINDQLILTLSDIKSDGNILPLPVLTVEKRILDGAEIAVITVMPSDMPPVKYDGRIWIRTGSRRALANEQEERILNEKRRFNLVPYDLRPFETACLDDLSRVFFEEEYLPKAFAKEVLDANNRSYEERLASCKMIFSVDNTSPTLSGLLAIGKNPRNFIYGAYIQFVRIEGDKLGDPAAIMQILYNAVQHRNYDGANAPVLFYWFNDRLEIISPGGPCGSITPENFGKPGLVEYRNINITQVMKDLGFIQRFGQGINAAREAMRQNGSPPIEFDVDNTHVRCVLRKKTSA
jgi:ATP-dependent DNA helicase RecG